MKKSLLTILLVAMAAVAASADRHPVARKLIHSQGCLACHRLEGSGGDFAVPLDAGSSRLSAEQLRTLLKKGKNSPTEPFMPAYNHLSEEELDQLIQFLLGLPTKP